MKHLQGKLGVVLDIRKREANSLLKNAKIEKKDIKALVVLEQEAEVLEEIEEGKEVIGDGFAAPAKEFEDSVSDSEDEAERRAQRDGIDEVDEEFDDAIRGQVK